ncbi:MAG: hypothetical protein IT331_02315 [Anaerolineae bacterium]|nr:hypothetical protein [Anaerolineae bacterium]
MQDNERIIELIAKSIDEPLTAPEQALVDAAMQNSLAIRVAADGLREFDALLKRTGMVLPDEGFPLRVLARVEAYEKHRSRIQWLLTLLLFFLGSFAALFWFLANAGALVNTAIELVSALVLVIPLAIVFLFALIQFVGHGPLLLYALIVLALTVLWARVSGSWVPSHNIK